MRRAAAAALLAALLLIAGCAGRGNDRIDDPLRLKRISFDMKPGANGNRPVRIDMVRVTDRAKVTELVGMDAPTWYGADGEAFRAANPGAALDRWELVPGRPAGPFDIARRRRAAGILFCDARGGLSPLRLDRRRHVTVTVDERGCTIAGDRPKESFGDRLRRSKTTRLSFEVDAQVNGRRPLRVALVRVKDAGLVSDLSRYDGDSWFGTGGAAFRVDHPDALYDDWELVPGGSYGPFRLAVNRKVAGMLFCGMPGARPLRLDWARTLEVKIDVDGCRLPMSPREARWNPLIWSRRR